jgi:hypothetical protein
LTFPLAADDFNRWETYEDAVFLSSKVILTPEAAGSSGILQSMIPNPIKDTWVARVDFRMARDKFKRKDWLNGDGMAIYYLRSIVSDPPEQPNYYGYFDNFDGVGIFISPNKSQKTETPIRKVQIQARSSTIKYERVQEVDKKKKHEREFHSCF